MIPLRDVIPSRTRPVVTTALIVLNALVFLRQFGLAPELDQAFVFRFGLVPAEFSWVNVFTSMFVHGGLMHVGGNMLYLWIFGDNVEDRMGHGRFLAFYLLSGIGALPFFGGNGVDGGGVAYWAHIGGFVAGIACGFFFRPVALRAQEAPGPEWPIWERYT
jgi:membrane associated rhomboid family serine protease